MNKKFDRMVIGIAIIAFAITPAVYSLDIRVLWAVILDFGEISIVAVASVFTGFLSVLIAGFALWLSRQADKRNEKQARLSVQPLLQIVPDTSGPTRIQWLEFKIINQGLGPAIIKNFILQFDDKELTRNNQNSHVDKVKEKLERRGIEDLKIGFLIIDKVIKAEESKLLLMIEYDVEKYNTDGIEKLDILVEYYSLYKDKTFTCSTKDVRLPDDSESK